MRAAPWAVLVLAVASSAGAHEHMYIASTASGSGTLVLADYDFARPFPVVELPNAPGTSIGVDPSFDAFAADDPARGLYRIKNGRKITMQITAIDPDLTVVFNGKTLQAPNDRVVIGSMPYLHQHPQWTLTLPPGTVGSRHVSFLVRGEGYQPSQVYTGVVTNVPDTTSTTTTLPDGVTTTTTTTLPLDCTVAGCDDGDACTTDVCVDGACRFDPVAGVDAVLCRLEDLSAALNDVTTTSRAGRRAFVRLYRAVGRARASVQAAAGGPTTRRLHHAKKLVSRLTPLVDTAVRAGLFTGPRADVLRDLASSAYDQLTIWSASPG
ncbi:MAG TPA: hypothetical protein VMS22_18215 [Candidatus Eisenbacteria bacterium]|nr:hypothetical protein [Candidatus Eisenbacteria bacterium]